MSIPGKVPTPIRHRADDLKHTPHQVELGHPAFDDADDNERDECQGER